MPSPQRLTKRSTRDAGFAWLLLLPTLIPLAAFTLYPALRSVYLSFFDFNAFMTRSRFVGIENYRLLFVSIDYWQSLLVTLAFVAGTALPSVVIALAVATALDLNPHLRGVLRTVFLMPVAVSSAMAAMLWVFLYNPSSGYLNFVLDRLGVAGPNWLGDPRWSLFAVSLTTVWKELGFNVIFILAGLAGVPNDLREAAALDGANAVRIYRHVTLPILAPTLFFVSVVSMLNSFQSFGQIHILTGGGPAGSTTTLVYNLYRDAFQNFQTGPASAQAVVLFAIMLLGTLVQFRVAKGRT